MASAASLSRSSFLGSFLDLSTSGNGQARISMASSSKLSSSYSGKNTESARLRAVSLGLNEALENRIVTSNSTDEIFPRYELVRGVYPHQCSWNTSGLSGDPETFAKTRALEVIHARWAMIGVVGCLVPEVLARVRASSEVGSAVWFKPGVEILSHSHGSQDSVFHSLVNALDGAVFSHPETLATLVAVQILITALVEGFRVAGGPLGDASDPIYPGGSFDPLGFAESRNPTQLAELKGMELQNGRLAMFSMLGFLAQAIVTGKGPIDNLLEHLSDPSAHNALVYAQDLLPYA
eukprot:TRINITY_DN15003_c0_g2_i1.p1 TRINITY_DN15003_c0_g2~~TRINITY_DN15003_c0_g2_i1.p1  ORF type:complete len:293 (-),score=6.81 TRINITY_DN15003_c0_g2_i1:129-1007(-)